MTDLNLYMLLVVRNIILIGTGIVLLVVGILITSNKIKPTRILGIAFIISAVTSLISRSTGLLMRYGNVETFARTSSATSVIVFAGSIAATLCVCIFLHKRYGSKFVYIPLLLLPLVSRFASVIVTSALNGSGVSSSELGYWISLVYNINSLVTEIAAALIIIIILYKNSSKEDLIPKTWALRTITLIWNCFVTGVTVTTYCANLAKIKAGSNEVTIFASSWLMNSDSLGLLVEMISGFVALIIPIYVLVMIVKASKSMNEETA